MKAGSKIADGIAQALQRMVYKLKGTDAALEHFASTPDRWAADPRSADPSWNVHREGDTLSIARIVE